MPIYEFYVPWDTGVFVNGITQLTSSMGNIINVGLRGFLIITAVYFVVKIGNSLIG